MDLNRRNALLSGDVFRLFNAQIYPSATESVNPVEVAGKGPGPRYLHLFPGHRCGVSAELVLEELLTSITYLLRLSMPVTGVERLDEDKLISSKILPFMV